jgi:O-antigen ligase
MMSVDHTRNPHVERLVLTSIVLLAALPAIMTFARTSPPLIAAVIAFLLGIGAWRDGTWPIMGRQLRSFATGPAGMLLIAGLALMALSLFWTPAPERALRHLLQLLGSVLVIGIVLTGIPWRYKEKFRLFMPLGLALAALLVVAHFTWSGAVNALLGAPIDGFYVNRTAVALALFAPIVLTALWRKGNFLAAVGLGLIVLAAIWQSDSWSAKLASLAIAGSLPLSLLAPRRFHMLAATGILATLLAAPFYVGHLNNLIPSSVHDTVGYNSLTIRGEIWREYASLVWHRPLLGFGLEASNVIQRTDIVAGFSEAQIGFLSFGHPHNAVLQIWFEFGLVGVLVAASLLGLLFWTMARLQDWQLAIATTTSLGVYAVACVSHGAWQAWWICLVGLVAFAFMLQIICPTDRNAQNPEMGKPSAAL